MRTLVIVGLIAGAVFAPGQGAATEAKEAASPRLGGATL